MTGDNEKTAKMIASQAGIDNILWEVRPDGKAEKIKKLQGKGKKVAMVGDGINDAPAIVTADLGIAMSSGTDVAIESADVMLLGGNIKAVPEVITASAKTMKNIKGNLCWALFYNAVFIPIAACGFINPAVAAAAMICPQCEDEIADRLIHKRGIINVTARYRKSLVSAEFDPDIINEEQIKAKLENMGYAESKRGNSGLISDTICIGAISFLLSVLSVLKKGCLCQQSVIMLRSV